jgi:cytochrome c553
MNRKIRIFANGVLAVIVILLLAACAASQPVGASGTAWGTGAFHSNGERIYFTATSERGTAITYTGGPASNGWMMGNGQLACASCHGPNGQGGKHSMGMMQVMDAKDIRWSALQSEFDAEKFRLAVTEGQDPDGTQLSTDMPRWTIGDDDQADLIAYLKTLP